MYVSVIHFLFISISISMSPVTTSDSESIGMGCGQIPYIFFFNSYLDLI